MSKLRLRQAMEKAQVTSDDISARADVHIKTVERWVRGERVPQPRFRFIVADLVGVDAYVLWPDSEVAITGNESTSEIIAVYAHRADTTKDQWWALIEQGHKQIDFLGFAIQFLPEQHTKLIPTLRERAQNGCCIRIAVANPECEHVNYRDTEEGLDGTLAARIKTTLKHFAPLKGIENVEIGFHETPMYNSVFRCDDQMFVTPHVFGRPGMFSPLFTFAGSVRAACSIVSPITLRTFGKPPSPHRHNGTNRTLQQSGRTKGK